MKESAIILLSRGEGDDLEVFWSQRRHDMRFLGGFWAFAGGSLEEEDAAIPQSESPIHGFPEPAFYGCAARELFEEMGLWVGSDGVRHVCEDAELARLRDRLGEDDPAAFARAMRDRGAAIAIDRFLPVGRWITPEWFDLRHDSEFFTVHLTGEESARFGARLADSLLEAELQRGEWTDPDDALRQWRLGTRFVSPPIRFLLEAFAEVDSPDEVDLHSQEIDFGYDAWLTTDGIYVVPLKSPTIPPATHTNCLLVGQERFVIIDPGSPFDDQQELLERLVGGMVDDGMEPQAVILTHHHADHVGGARAVAERFDTPIWAHAETARHLEGDLRVARHLRDGERLDLGPDSMEVLYTPGHASGHVCLLHERTNAVFAGDLIASQGTILVNPPDGHMGDYLESLRRVRELEPSAIYPAHGWVVTNPLERLQFYVDHRLEREEKVFDALERFGEPATAMEIVPDAYDDAPKKVWPIAARSAEAHLIHLEEVGRVAGDDGHWKVTGSSRTPGREG